MFTTNILKKTILFLFLSFWSITIVHAQWQQVNGPYGGDIRCFATNGGNMYAGTSGAGVFLSTNNGTNWTPINNGVTGVNLNTIGSLVINSGNMYAGTSNGVFRSTNNGSSWTLLPGSPCCGSDGSKLAVSGSTIFVGWAFGVRRSINNGSSWTTVNTGLSDVNVQSLIIDGSNIYAGTYQGGIFISTNNGNSWSPINTGLTNLSVHAIAVNGTSIYAGTEGGGVFISNNNGSSWSQINTGLYSLSIWAFAISGSEIYAGTNGGGVFVSTNSGNNWTSNSTGITNYFVRSLMKVGTNVYAGTNGAGIFKSINNGTSWSAVNNGVTGANIQSIAVKGGNLFVGTYGNGISMSSNNLNDWSLINNGLYDLYSTSLIINGETTFAGTGLYGGIFKSINNGASWTTVNTGLTNLAVSSFAISGSNIFAGTYGGGVFLSTNSGNSWTAVNNGLTNQSITSMVVSGTNIFVGTFGSVFLSTNNGSNWTVINNGLTNTNIESLTTIGTRIFAGTFGGGVFLSSNNGGTWSAINNGITGTGIIANALANDGTNVYAGTNKGIYVSTNNGNSWNLVNSGLQNNEIINSLAISGTTIFAGTPGKGLWSSPLPSYLYTFVNPKTYITKASLNVGETQTITGKDFTTGGMVKLSIQNSNGDSVPVNTISYLPNGGFTYQLPITASMLDGEYSVYARDVNTSKISTTVKFKVNNSVQRRLWVREPDNAGKYEINQQIIISWGDFAELSNVTGYSSYVQKRYKIECSKNNGASWIIIENEKRFNILQYNQDNIFHIDYAFLQTGNYQVRITDLDNITNFNTSSFTVSASTAANFTSSLEWDYSLPKRYDKPIGLAADGTSRILVKLKKSLSNKKLVKKITAKIESDGGSSFSGIDMLGKIMPAKIIDTYTEEGNNANNTTTDTTYTAPYSNTEFWFWLVAPNDFIQNLNSQDTIRTLKIKFDITYSDNTIDVHEESKIKVVRPPVIMVHGLNGSPESFANMKYNVNGNVRYFKNAGGENSLFKNLVRVNLKNYASFKDNAEILLGIGDIAYRSNSFQRILKTFHDQRFAASKVDYVCHSMGGNIARTVINQYEEYYKPKKENTALKYKNYSRGFINKLITINTPHNGSPVADFVDDFLGSGFTTNTYLVSKDNLGGFFTKRASNNFFTYYDPSPAIKDLRAVNGGVRFKATSVKNHMIGGDIDRYNIPDALVAYIVNDPSSYIDYMEMMGILVEGSYSAALFSNSLLGLDAIVNSLNAVISLRYGYGNFLSNSDGIVPIASQFAGRPQSSIPEIETNLSTVDNATLGYGFERNHVGVTDDLAVGTTVMRLLNAKINSGYFSDQIPGNNKPGGTIYRQQSINSPQDSIFNYVDTNFIKIINPTYVNQVSVDSAVDIKLRIKDTVRLRKIRLVFQGQLYESSSRIEQQSFNIKINSSSIGLNSIAVDAMYDSVGFTIHHTDTATIRTKSLDTMQGLYLIPKSQNLNKQHIFNITTNVVYNHFIGTLHTDADSLKFSISDTNVVRYDSSFTQFVTKDTGTAYIIFAYKGFKDTTFVYVGSPSEENITKACPQSNLSFFAGSNDTTKNYQWQVDTANSFKNINPSAVYLGTNSSTLNLNNAPTNWYNYKYRCIISDSIGSTTSEVFTLKFATTWIGGSDTAWENPANWSCAALPDTNTDVTISSTAPHFPQVNTNVSCRSLMVQHGAAVLVKTGYKIDIKGKDE